MYAEPGFCEGSEYCPLYMTESSLPEVEGGSPQIGISFLLGD